MKLDPIDCQPTYDAIRAWDVAIRRYAQGTGLSVTWEPEGDGLIPRSYVVYVAGQLDEVLKLFKNLDNDDTVDNTEPQCTRESRLTDFGADSVWEAEWHFYVELPSPIVPSALLYRKGEKIHYKFWSDHRTDVHYVQSHGYQPVHREIGWPDGRKRFAAVYLQHGNYYADGFRKRATAERFLARRAEQGAHASIGVVDGKQRKSP